MLSCALGTTTSPLQYQSNNSAGVVVGLGDEPVQRHAYVSQHLDRARLTCLAPSTHRSTTDISPRSPGRRTRLGQSGDPVLTDAAEGHCSTVNSTSAPGVSASTVAAGTPSGAASAG